MRILKIALLLVSTLTVTFCGNDKKSNDSSSDTISEVEVIEVDTKAVETYPESELTATFKNEKVGEAYKQYSKLQNALVNTNATNAAAVASDLALSLKNLGREGEVMEAVEKVVDSRDIKVQRKQFVIITAEMEKVLDKALASGTIYKMYCPMASRNTGAYWLSSDNQVQNPYFGNKMYRCGRVDSAIK